MERVEVLLQLVAHRLQRRGRIRMVFVAMHEQPARLAHGNEVLVEQQHAQRRMGLAGGPHLGTGS